MPESLPTTPEPNTRKLLFVGLVSAVIFVVIAFFVFMSSGSKTVAGKGFDPESTQITIWTVGMEPKTFVDLKTQFNKYLGRSDMKLNVENFASFDDYVDILPRAMLSKAPPDLIMVPNHGGDRFFEQYIDTLGDSIVDFTDFETRFHKLFFEELVFSQTLKGDGQDRIIRGLRGVPFGFEPLGTYYNRNLVQTVPILWQDLSKILKRPSEEYSTPAPRNSTLLTVTSPGDAQAPVLPSFTNLGYGAATPSAADILVLLMAQKSELLINTYAAINSIEARGVFEEYMNFRRTPNNLERFDAQFDATLTTTDLFVRGKIATLIGYPSTYEDIKIAIQRAKRDGEFSPDFLKNIRVTTVPQEELDPKKQINFARYMYFALVKNGANRDVKNPSDDPVVKFVQFLLTSEAQDIFIKHQYYYLPTQNKSLLEMKDTKINSDNSFSMIVGDWYVPGQTFALYDMGIPHLFRFIVKEALDEPGTVATNVTALVSGYLNCKVGQLTDPAQYAKPCLCRTTLPVNGNNYWPLCGQE